MKLISSLIKTVALVAAAGYVVTNWDKVSTYVNPIKEKVMDECTLLFGTPESKSDDYAD
ncbi:hypothetical protein SDC9_43984 [bioreactor metagenome]|uniref:Uncharacterized protein n=1 Tax=bioreactor metagenome TaxID=1076179 RepID=A0A644W242_9ZZZZ